MDEKQQPRPWWVYMLRCGDGTLYTGCTDNFPRRLEAHRQGRGARYTRGRGPLEPVYLEKCPDHGAALRREYALKQLKRQEKLALIARFRKEAAAGHSPEANK